MTNMGAPNGLFTGTKHSYANRHPKSVVRHIARPGADIRQPLRAIRYFCESVRDQKVDRIHRVVGSPKAIQQILI